MSWRIMRDSKRPKGNVMLLTVSSVPITNVCALPRFDREVLSVLRMVSKLSGRAICRRVRLRSRGSR